MEGIRTERKLIICFFCGLSFIDVTLHKKILDRVHCAGCQAEILQEAREEDESGGRKAM